jgi:death-on-curing protein
VIVCLELDDLVRAAERIGGPDCIRDLGLLSSAIHRHASVVFGVDVYPTLDLKAAALLTSVVSNHALIDGNKRLGWVAVRLFNGLNDIRLRYDEEEAYQLVLSIAKGLDDDVQGTATVLASWHLRRGIS